MKPIKLIGTAALFVLLGIGVPAFARQDKPDDHGGQTAGHDNAKPAQQQSKPAQQQQAKPAARQQQAKPAQQQAAKPARQQQQAAKPAQHQQQAKAPNSSKPATRQTQQPQQAKQQQQRTSGQQGHVQRTAAQQQTQRSQPAVRVSSRNTNRIPDARFRSNFGQGHSFHMGNPEMVGGYSRFSYGGFQFGFVQPWPMGWYYTDDVYIDYIDGEYFLFDPYYPGQRMEISVIM
ncbi:MAG: hypothetical protein WA871_00285 [Candidatus Acidiferrales bacterium]